MKRGRIHSESGAALIIALLALITMTLMSIYLFQTSALDLLIYGNSRASANAVQAGETCTNVATRNFLANIITTTPTTITSALTPQCIYAPFTVSNGEAPVGYEVGSDAPLRY